jgi:D-alanine-D-alanine ligase
MLDRLAAERVDGVFNMAEGMGGRGRESQVPALLDMYRIPYTGSSALALAMTLDKSLGKMVAQANGIPTAPFMVIPRREDGEEWGWEADLTYPLFAKPSNEGSSMGITAKSLCHNERELDEAVARLSRYGAVLVEEFLPGEEYTVGVVDGQVVGVMQVVSLRNEPNFIYSLEVKREYEDRVTYRLAEADDAAQVALQVWRALGLRDLARVDIRRDRNGVPNFVEVNPLPGVHPVKSDLVILARFAGVSYNELIGRVLDSAARRWACAS